MNFYKQSAFGAVESGYATAVKAHSSLGDGQAQSNSPGLTTAVIVQTVEGLKQFFQRIRRNAGSAIRYADHRLRTFGGFNPLQTNVNRCTLTRVTYCVPHHVLDGTV
jgi:hypothetical protein